MSDQTDTSPSNVSRWHPRSLGATVMLNRACLVLGFALSAYLAAALVGEVSSSVQFYAVFVLGVTLISGLLAIRNVIYELLDIRIEEAGNAAPAQGAAGALRVTPRVLYRLLGAIAGTLIATVGAAYVCLYAERLSTSAPFFSHLDVFMGALLTAGILIVTFYHWGIILTAVIAGSIVYFFYGDHIANPLLNHPHYSTNFILNYIGLGVNQGFYWFAQTAADDLYFLVMYSCFLFGMGMLKMVIEVGKATGNRVGGGAAGPAIIGSSVVAATMGQAVSNVALCGRFTIPLMKSHGYTAEMAGAIEATASTSGQIMPPVLGLSAFIIASFLGIAYVDVVKAAVLPGILYMTGVTIGIWIYAKRNRLPRLKEKVDTKVIWRLLPTFICSFVVVIVLLVNYYSASIAGLAGIITAIVLSFFQGPYRPKAVHFKDAFFEGIALVSILSLLLIAIGPLGQAFLTTNLSGRLGTWLLSVLPSNQLVFLFGAAVLSIALGTGLPTPVAYLMVALSAVPFLIQLGIKPLEANYFAFYFAVYSALTPPVALAAMAAQKISGASYARTCAQSMKLAATTFIIPFAFVYNPSLMAFPHASLHMLAAVVEVLVIQFTSSFFLYAWCFRNLNRWEQAGFGVVTGLGYWAMISPLPRDALVSLGAMLLMMAVSWLRTPRALSTVAR
jgi:TRAP transporter 4TM/12TM fusion protein